MKNAALTVTICLGLLGAAIFYAIAAINGAEGSLAPPSIDSMIFYQYARALAEGRPYRFIAGDAPSTGSTSHLYPALLAVFYAVGFRGASLAIGGFVLGVGLWVATLSLVGRIARAIDAPAATLAAALAATSGVLLFHMFGQNDMGLFVALAHAALAAGLAKRWGFAAVALALATLTRPEGAILSAGLIAAACVRDRTGGFPRARAAMAGGAGLAALAGVFPLNWSLTGAIGFQSVAAKGYSVVYPPYAVALESAKAAGALVSGVFFGLGGEGRGLYWIPALGGMLCLAGIVSRDWRNSPTARVEAWWLGSILACSALVAASGWEGLQYDRYMAWMLPAFFLYAAIGARAIAARLGASGAYGILAGAMLLYQAPGIAYFGAAYYRSTQFTQTAATFAAEACADLPDGARVGVNGLSGLQYAAPKVSLVNVAGVTTPLFSQKAFGVAAAEILKHEADARFDFWLIPQSQAQAGWQASLVDFPLRLQMPIAGEANSLGLYRARWDVLQEDDRPLTPEAQVAATGLALADRMDVGYWRQERERSYETAGAGLETKNLPFFSVLDGGGRRVGDVGRVIAGSDSFTAELRGGRRTLMILRLGRAAAMQVYTPNQGLGNQKVSMPSPSRLRIAINGHAQDAVVRLAQEETAFSEATVWFEADWVTEGTNRIGISGEHIAYGYSFYQ